MQNDNMHILNNIEGIAVINMDTRPDRYARFMEKTGVYLPESRIHRISAVMGRDLPSFGKAPWFTEATGDRAGFWGGTGGCALSHRKAIEWARDNKLRHVLVFEDDVVVELHQGIAELLDQALETLTGPYMLYLGYNRPAPCGELCMKNGDMELWKTDGVIAAHAYIVSSELYETLLEHMPTEENVWEWLSKYRAIDVLYRDFVPFWKNVSIYVLNPVVCVQDDNYSDIGQMSFAGIDMACRQAPRRAGLVQNLVKPLRWLKIMCNSVRTQRRARRGGLPGFRKRKKQ